MEDYPLGVPDAAVVSVVRLKVRVSSVPPGIRRVALRSGVRQKLVGFLRVDTHVTQRHHLC